MSEGSEVQATTRITIVQSGFGPWLKDVKDTFGTHWRQIVADFRLFLERGIAAPGAVWGADIGAWTRETPTGLILTTVQPDAFCARVGMAEGDLLLSLRGIRVHDTQQLWTIQGLSERGDEIDATWVRGRETLAGSGVL